MSLEELKKENEELRDIIKAIHSQLEFLQKRCETLETIKLRIGEIIEIPKQSNNPWIQKQILRTYETENGLIIHISE